MTTQDLQMALINLQVKRTKRLRAMREKRAELVRIMEEARSVLKHEWDHFERWKEKHCGEVERLCVVSFIADADRIYTAACETLAEWDIRNGAILRALEKETSK